MKLDLEDIKRVPILEKELNLVVFPTQEAFFMQKPYMIY